MRRTIAGLAVALVAALLLAPLGAADATPRFDYEFATPLFGLAKAPGGGLFVADAGAGVVRLNGDSGSLVAELPNITDIAPIRHGVMHAVTGGGDAKLYRIHQGEVSEVADLGAFEAEVNPDGGEIDSNPFDVAKLPNGKALVADAAANALLIVRPDGHVNWVATLPTQMVPTYNAKTLAGCPDPPPDLADICDLPSRMPAQAVATSVAVGPDGAWYVGELKGFPAPRHKSKVWRIEPGTRHAECGSSSRCSVFAQGFTSVIDLNVGVDGSLQVVEFDEASWFAVELGKVHGGTVNTCDVWSGDCHEFATDLPMPTAVASTGRHVFATIQSLVPGQADVVAIG
ncbi:MAG: ScyD/ScyE family protein [Actinobacteria bacterium]|nr:ScyD/ScyE family protein [Actinomycetota bacterium]